MERNRGRERASRDEPETRSRGGRDEEPRGGRRGRGEEAATRFSYQKRSAEQVNKRAAMSSRDYDNYLVDEVKMFKPNDGPNTIRILPPTWPNPEHYGIDIWVHYGIGPDEQAYLCSDKMKGEPCAICEERARARQAGEDEDYVKQLSPTRRALFYLIDRDKEREGVLAWAAPQSVDQSITTISVDRKTQDVLPIDDPDNGYDVEFDRTGKGMTTKYVGMAIARRESPLGDSKWLQHAIDFPLPQMLKFYDFDHIAKALGGGGRHTSSRDKEDDRDSARSSRDHGRDQDSPRRGSDRASERESSRRNEEPEYTWESIHAMSGDELDDLCGAVDTLSKVDPNKADNDEDLADWICEVWGIEKEVPKAARSTAKEEPSTRDRLRSMRENRKD